MNCIFYNLSFGRRVVVLNDYFPDPACTELRNLIKCKTWGATSKPNRQTADLENTFTKSYLENFTVDHAYSWTGKKHKLIDCYMWKDTEGLSYKQHTDVGIFKQWENHLQIYINADEPDITMGTRFHHSMFHRKPTLELSYTNNTGYFIKNSQTIFHSVSPVPHGKIRYSLYARFGVI